MEKTKYKEDSVEKLLLKTFFIVEANSFEQFCLWQQHSNQSDTVIFTPMRWKELHGWSVQVGSVFGRPVTISLMFVEISGKLICFLDPTSQLVDHAMIDDWLAERFSGTWDRGTRKARTDAMNFAHCIHAIEGR